MTPLALPHAYERIRIVSSFHELITTPLAQGINALCWQRTLSGNFGEVVEMLGAGDGMTTLDEERLLALPVSAEGGAAVKILVDDLRLLREHGLAPVLDCIVEYPRDDDAAGLPTDVYSFHADRATVEADTYLCTYYGAASEGIRNEEARRHVDIPETRARLLQLFGGEEGDEFLEFLKENCYDLHYAPAPDARPYSFGLGNLWRIAVSHPESQVPPCIHRAPGTIPGQPPRLLLIS